jgi:membrane-associated phospholipid phosphatase
LISPKPISVSLQKTRYFLLYYSVLLTGTCILIFNFPKSVTFFFINGHHHPFADIFFKYITFLGDGIFYALLVIYFLIKERRFGFTGLWSFAASSLFAQILKRIFFPGALRPKRFFENSPLLHFLEGVNIHGMASFPSGHTASAFSIALWLSYKSGNRYLSLLYLLLASLVGYSRVYLAQHFLEDVTMGSFIGVMFTLVIIFIMERSKKSDKV